MSRRANRESFYRLAATCPDANSAHTKMASIVDGAISDYHDEQKRLRDKLRDALTEACERIIEVEDELEEAIAERDRWRATADDYEREIARLQKEVLETA